MKRKLYTGSSKDVEETAMACFKEISLLKKYCRSLG
jgi:hypothetical protein